MWMAHFLSCIEFLLQLFVAAPGLFVDLAPMMQSSYINLLIENG